MIKLLKEKVLEFFRDDAGQTSTEYILLVAVVAMIVFKFKTVASAKLEGLTNSIFDKAQSDFNLQ